MNVLIRWSQLHTLHIHSDGNRLSLIRTPIHHLIFHKSFSLCFCCGTSTESLLANEADFHAFNFDLNEVEIDPSHDDILEMVERFVVLEIYMKAILDSHLHLHRDYFSIALDWFIGKQNRKILLFSSWKFIVFGNNHTNKVTHTSSNTVECLILLLEIWKLELIGLIFCQNSSRLKLLWKRVELCR